jgi:hypothetical protein
VVTEANGPADHADLYERARRAGATRAYAALCAVLDLHTPVAPPPGKTWVSGGALAHCKGCSTGDPFDDELWPCPTVQAITANLL